MYPLNPTLMELLVLSLIYLEDSYGYQISRQMRQVSNLKDSTLYPVLRRLAENGDVLVYDKQFQGRNRKYYQITASGKERQEMLAREWDGHVDAVRKIVEKCRYEQGGGADE